MTDDYMTKFKEKAEDAYEIGSIWYTSWGYDQTNIEYFQVVRETKGTLTLRRIASAYDEETRRVYPVQDEFTIDFLLQGNSTSYDPATGDWGPNANYVRDQERGYSEKVARKSKWGSLKIGGSRRAYPYDGGGRYDTLADGQPGH